MVVRVFTFVTLGFLLDGVPSWTLSYRRLTPLHPLIAILQMGVMLSLQHQEDETFTHMVIQLSRFVSAYAFD